jgi:hypothetical protein
MSQFGMQMPSGRIKKGGGPDVYTLLAFIACGFLAVAIGVVFSNAKKVGKDGSPFGMQDTGPGKIQLVQQAAK